MSDNQLIAIIEVKNMAATIFDIGTLIVRSPDICGDRPMFLHRLICLPLISRVPSRTPPLALSPLPYQALSFI